MALADTQLASQRGRKSAGTPLVISDAGACAPLVKLDTAKVGISERWLQELAFHHPQVLPIVDIEPGFGVIYPVAMEVPCGHGFIDNLYITATGDIVLVEAKLWRNPQARRELVAQALDYVAALMSLGFEGFEKACLKGEAMTAPTLFALVADKPDALDEQRFVDAVSNNLMRGRMLVIGLGDGIRAEAEALASLLQGHAGAHFTFALVELAIWKSEQTGELIALPSTLAQTVMITRGVVSLAQGSVTVAPAAAAPAPGPVTISEELYFEELARLDPALPALVRSFVAQLEPLGIYADQKASLNLKIELLECPRPINFGYITRAGKLWTDTMAGNAPAVIAEDYNQALADLIGGTVTHTTGGSSYLTANGKSAPLVTALLPQHAAAWEAIIKDTVQQIRAAGRDDNG